LIIHKVSLLIEASYYLIRVIKLKNYKMNIKLLKKNLN